MAEPKSHSILKQGLVVGNKMEKTAVVQVERRIQHPRYKRMIRRRKKFLAHDEAGQCQPGDWVEIIETRPLSRRKHFRVHQILRKGSRA